jgi:predicted metal-dependent HD superfamily phosphohydrolase
MTSDNPFVQKTAEYAENLLQSNIPADLVYHNLDHTIDVAESSLKIGRRSGLEESELEILLIAAWMHDVGYTVTYNGHEEAGVAIAESFLRGIGYPEERIARVAGGIMATKVPQSPQNLLEDVLCDADLCHLGRGDFERKGNLLRLEWERHLGNRMSDIEWLKLNRDFLKGHRFHTTYAAIEYEPKRLENIAKLRKKLRKLHRESLENGPETIGEPETREEPARRGEKGNEGMLRRAIHNHGELNAIADRSAGLMIASNAMLFLAALFLFGEAFAAGSYLTAPALLLLATSLGAIVFAVLSARPAIIPGPLTEDDPGRQKVSLLFPGNIGMSPADYEAGIRQMVNDRDALYGSVMRETESLRYLLERKVGYLRICHNVFMYGLITSVVAYGIIYLVFGGRQ